MKTADPGRSEGLMPAGLAHDEQRYRELFETAPDGIFIAGPDGRYTDVNAAGCRLLGYSREELIGRSIAELVAPEDLARQASLKRHVLEGGMEVSEWRLRRKDGTFVTVELSSNALPDGHLRAFVRDLTSRNAAEVALRLSEAKLSGIVSSSPDAIISVDEAQHITMFNEGAESMFGYSKAEMIGARLEQLMPERFRQRHHEHVQRFADGPNSARRMGTRSVELYGLRKNGQEFAADAAISKIEVGRERLLTVSLRDVTDRKRIADEERLLAEVGRILVEAGPDYERLLGDVANALVRGLADWCSVDIVQAGNVRRLRLVHADPAMARTCEALEHYPAVRNRMKPIAEVLETHGPVLMSELPAGWLESIAESAEHLRLMQAFDPGSFIVVPLLARDQTLGTLSIGAARASRRYGAEDLRLVEQLASRVALAVDNARLHEDLERAVRARDEVLGIVAHDLRSPLNAIVLQSQILRRQKDAERPDQRAIESIRGAATRMNALIQDLLDVARLEAGERLSTSQKPVDTASLLAEAVEQQHAALSEKQISVEVKSEPSSVWADRVRVLQVLDNLLGNALKFCRSRISLGAARKDGQVRFWVADDGAGIAPEALSHVFDRFWQSARGDRRGAGLGLSIVKAIVEAHGGRVWAESQPGAGTQFYFTLPESAMDT
ncbi:MAG: PAS domain S-box protein [Myxococcales bacterium]